MERIGFDLDGVIAQHVLAGFWFKLRKLKEKILRKSHDQTYYYPKSSLERLAWRFIDWGRPPLQEKKEFCRLAKKRNFEFYLITGRFRFLEKLTRQWLKKYGLADCFQEIVINVQDQDPMKFKLAKIKSLKLDYFIDDEEEVVNFLRQQTSAKIFLQQLPPVSLVKLLNSWLAN